MVTVSRQILVSAPRESVQQYLQDLRNMGYYGPRLESVEFGSSEEQSGFIEVSGRFLGLPWKGSFKAEFTRDGGVRLEMVRGPLPGLSEGFHLRQVAGGTVITHDQKCRFPILMRLFSPLFKNWLASTMDRQLFVIKEGAERLHRQLQIKQIESV